jgi:uncharacterized membrane protein
MVKLQLEEGTTGSRQFLQTLVEEGTKNKDIFLFKNIQRILEFKQENLFKVIVVYFLQYALYLASLMIFPVLWPDDFVIVMLWLFFQLWMEYVQATSQGSFTNTEYRSNWHKLWEMTKDYYGIWNMLDVLRLILMALYVIFSICYLVNKPDQEDDSFVQPSI